MVTIGSQGALVAGFPAKAVDTTGAGDSFWGGLLTCLSEGEKSLPDLTFEDFQAYARFGNAVASLCVEKQGAMPAMPSRDTVLQRISQGTSV